MKRKSRFYGNLRNRVSWSLEIIHHFLFFIYIHIYIKSAAQHVSDKRHYWQLDSRLPSCVCLECN